MWMNGSFNHIMKFSVFDPIFLVCISLTVRQIIVCISTGFSPNIAFRVNVVNFCHKNATKFNLNQHSGACFEDYIRHPTWLLLL